MWPRSGASTSIWTSGNNLLRHTIRWCLPLKRWPTWRHVWHRSDPLPLPLPLLAAGCQLPAPEENNQIGITHYIRQHRCIQAHCCVISHASTHTVTRRLFGYIRHTSGTIRLKSGVFRLKSGITSHKSGIISHKSGVYQPPPPLAAGCRLPAPDERESNIMKSILFWMKVWGSQGLGGLWIKLN
jgi:hypothetical protein